MLQIIQDQREVAWKDYGFHLCWEAGILVTLGMFLYVLVRVLCIQMKNVVRTGAGTPICLFAGKYSHHWGYVIINVYLFLPEVLYFS